MPKKNKRKKPQWRWTKRRVAKLQYIIMCKEEHWVFSQKGFESLWRDIRNKL